MSNPVEMCGERGWRVGTRLIDREGHACQLTGFGRETVLVWYPHMRAECSFWRAGDVGEARLADEAEYAAASRSLLDLYGEPA